MSNMRNPRAAYELHCANTCYVTFLVLISQPIVPATNNTFIVLKVTLHHRYNRNSQKYTPVSHTGVWGVKQ